MIVVYFYLGMCQAWQRRWKLSTRSSTRRTDSSTSPTLRKNALDDGG